MINLSYNLSSVLKERLEKIDTLRKEILIAPLSPKIELELKWKTILDRIYSSLSLANNPLSKNEVTKILTFSITTPNAQSSKKGLNHDEEDVLKYRHGLDYIRQHWMVSPKAVTVKDVLMLYDIICKGSLRVPISRVQELLDYLQAHKDHPVIQAGIANLGVILVKPFSDGNGRLARLITLLFLYKQGFDVRELIGFEKTWAQDKQTFQEAVQVATNAASITLWLEYFANSIIIQLTDALKEIRDGSSKTIGISPLLWEISDRQKEILRILEEPGMTITNRKVQEQFRVSQITASRDLSKLANLGLIFSHGKGRSIYYTKV